jgi:C1A family cysteine protease
MGNYISYNNNVDDKHYYGWKKDLTDVRDKRIMFKQHHYNQIRNRTDLRSKCPDVYNQGSLGSCTANAICSAFEFDNMEQGYEKFNPSRLFVYYNERKSEGTENYDSGASIRDGIKSINKKGICSELLWPYDIRYFTTKPYSKCYKEAKFHKCIRYKRLDNSNLRDLKTCLSLGLPFVFGFSVYSSFEDPTMWNPKIDEMPIPNPNKEKLLGGHAVMAVGYSDKRKCFIIRNSWGKDWGLDGYFFMPYKFITSEQCDDFWVIQRIINDEDKLEKKSFSEIVRNEKTEKKEKIEKTVKTEKNEKKEEETKNILVPKKEESEFQNNKVSRCMIRD